MRLKYEFNLTSGSVWQTNSKGEVTGLFEERFTSANMHPGELSNEKLHEQMFTYLGYSTAKGKFGKFDGIVSAMPHSATYKDLVNDQKYIKVKDMENFTR